METINTFKKIIFTFTFIISLVVFWKQDQVVCIVEGSDFPEVERKLSELRLEMPEYDRYEIRDIS